MVDIASLAIKIDTSDTARAEQALDRLAKTGGKAEQAAEGVGEAWRDAGASVGKAGSAAAGAGAGFDRASRAAKTQADIMQRAGLTAGQYNQAMRMLPMQLTDVVTSLSSGMPLWQVAIQQGGQVRDSFGGIGNAARGVSSAIGPMGLAIGGVAATLGTLLVAYQQGQNEAQAYEKALILTGNAAGLSADQLTMMAVAIDGVSGTQRKAAQALAEVAGTGKFAADQIQGIASAAIAMEEATGRAVSDTVKEFARLADEPAAASAKLNEQYNYLTAAVYEQIQALEEQGRTTEAARVATDAYASAVQERAGQITANLGALDSAWNGIKTAAAEAWDAMLDVGREQTLEQKLADAYEAAQRVRNRGKLDFNDEFQLGELEKQIAYYQSQIAARDQEAAQSGTQSKIQQAGVSAAQEIARIREQSLSKAEQKEKAIADYRKRLEEVRLANPDSALLDPAKIDKDIQAIEARFEETARKQKAYTDDAATRMLQGLRAQEASLQAQLEGNTKLTAAQQAQVEFAQRIADLKEKKILTADQQSLLANKEAIAAQLAENVALEDELQKRAQINDLERLRIQILRGSGQNAAANAAQFELDYAKQRAEYERQGNVEALKRLETLREIQRANGDASLPSGTVEGVSKAPSVGGLSPEVGGASGELIRLEQERIAIDEWRATELEKQMAFLEAKAINEQVYAERVRNINEQASEAQSNIASAMFSAQLGAASDLLGNLADITAQAAGEQSALYAVMFAAQKAFAVAQTIINAEMASAAALAPPPIGLGPVAGLPYSQVIRGIGYASAAVIGAQALMGMAHSGIDSVPREGTWLLDKGERVVDSRTNQDLKRYLNAANDSSAGGNVVVNLNEDATRAGTTQTRQMDGKMILDVFVSNIRQDGQASKALQQAFGIKRAGR